MPGMVAFTARAGAGLQVIGDDFLVTSAQRIAAAASRGACNAVLLKPNQAGTVTETKAAGSLLRFAPIQRIERRQDAPGLASKRGFIAAESINRAIGQIGQTQKATGELDNRAIRFDSAGKHRIALNLFS